MFPSIEEMSDDAQTSEFANSTSSGSLESSSASSRSSSGPDAPKIAARSESPALQSSSGTVEESVPAAFPVASPASVLLVSSALSMQALNSASSGTSDLGMSSSSENSMASGPSKQSPTLGGFLGVEAVACV